ncbi:MAG: YfhO family protein, partial [Chloroflexota bacterium]|nr:YfhO family protein [Chloroflexota bacterium]
MLPGLAPGRVVAPMEELLRHVPWSPYYPGLNPLFQGGDQVYQQLPWRHWMQNELAAGRFPLWSSGPAGGMPLFASAQPGVLYPLHLLWVLMPVAVGQGIIMVLKFWLAGLGMWVFLRALGLHKAASGLAALSFMFSASMVNWSVWQLSGVILLFPWLAWSIYAWYVHARPMLLVATALIVAAGILAGHPETLFQLGIVAIMWVAGLFLFVRPYGAETWKVRLSRVMSLGAASVLGFMIGAIQLLPFFEAVGLSHANVVREQSGDAGAMYHIPPEMMLNWVVARGQGHLPDRVFGEGLLFTESNAYVGLLPLFGILMLAVGIWRRGINVRLVLPWLAVGVFSWLVTYDEAIGTLIRKLPGFSHSVNVRWVIVLGFTVVVLGAFGLDWLARRIERGFPDGMGRATAMLASSMLALGTLGMLAYGIGLVPPPILEPLGTFYRLDDNYRWYWAGWSAALAVATLGVLGTWVAWRWGSRIAPLALGALLLLDLWWLLIPVNRTSPMDWYYPQTSFQTQVKEIVPPAERILVVGEAMPANTGLIYNIRDWRATDPMITERSYQALRLLAPDIHKSVYDEYSVFIRGPRREIAPLLGMSYYIFPAGTNPNYPEEENAPPYTRLAYKDGLSLWRAEGVPGFTYLTDRVLAVPDGDDALTWLKDASWATTRTYPAVVEGDPGLLSTVSPAEAASSPGSTQIVRYTPGRIVVQTEALRPALLVVAESWYPGWRAKLDTQPVPLLRTNYLSQGVVVPAGTHVVELEYSPDSFTYGMWLSIAGSLGVFALAAWAWRVRQSEAEVVT